MGGELLQIVGVAFELCVRIVFQRNAPSMADARFRGVWGGLKIALSGVESLGLPALGAIFVSRLIRLRSAGGAAGLRVTVIANR